MEIIKKKWGFSSLYIMHLIPLAAIFTGATVFDFALCIALYFVRMFFVTAGYHRYFSHRTYKTSRLFQFFLAFMAQTSAQKGVLWWAYTHRMHHKHSDHELDPHSAKLYGFWYSHIGWITGPEYKKTNLELVRDLSKYPEIRFIDRFHLLPAITLGVLVYLLGCMANAPEDTLFAFQAGWSTLWIGFFLSTVILYHGTFSINSLMHKIGTKRYKTDDESRNSLILALITLGEGWHNNHHYFQASTRQGFFPWEIDITYYVLKILSWIGLVYELRPVPDKIKYNF